MSTDDIVISAVDPPGISITAKADGTPTVAAAENGWAFVSRPRRSSYTWWNGVNGYTLTVPVLFDTWLANTGPTVLDVEGQLEALRRMARTPVGPRGEPAVVSVTGSTVPMWWLTWVIQNIEQGDQIRDDTSGRRVRQHLTLTLLQYLGADVVAGPAEAANALAAANRSATGTSAAAAAATGTAGQSYTVKAGDTLASIALALLGSFTRWHDIADLNGIRDPTSVQVGQTLKIPA